MATLKTGERCPTCGRKHKRSNPQNAAYWALLFMIAEQVKPEGKQHAAETWHIYFKGRFLGADDITLPNKKVVPIYRSSAALDVAEFSDYFEKVQAWAAERNIYLADMETT